MTTDYILTPKLAVDMIDHAIKDAQGIKSNRDGMHAQLETRHARQWLHGDYGEITLDDCVTLLGWNMEAVLDRYEWMISPGCAARLKISKAALGVDT